MLALSLFKLFCLGLFSEIFQKNRLQKSWAVVVLIFAAAIIVNMLTPDVMVAGKNFVFQWIDTSAIKVKLLLKPSTEMYRFGALLGMITLVVMFYNCFYDEGKMRLRNGGLYLLIFIVMMFLISAQNMMQILISVCFVDILCFYLLKDSNLKRRYMFYNMMADMALIIMCALIWGQIKSLNLGDMLQFVKKAPDKNIILGLWCLVVAVKSGVVLFHDFVLDLKKVSLVRGLFIFYVATPMAGLLLMWKMYPLLAASAWGHYVFYAWTAASVVWAFLAVFAVDDLKAKIMYWNMMLMGIMMGVLAVSKLAFVKLVPWLPWCGIMISTAMILPIVAASNEVLVSKMGQFAKKIKFSLLFTLLVIAAEVQIISALATKDVYWYLWIAVALQLLSVAHVLGQIYFAPAVVDEKVWALLKNPNLFYFLPLMAFVGLVFSHFEFAAGAVCLALGVVILVIVLRPMRGLNCFYRDDTLQRVSPCSVLYDWLLVTPIKVVGRVLWLMIDFVFIERTIINMLRKLAALMMKIVAMLHKDMKTSGILFTLLGVAVLCWAYYFRGRF